MTPSKQAGGQGGYFELQGAVRRDGKPFVITTIDGKPFGQLTPSEAMNHGIRAIQAAIEAERDAATLLGLTKAGLDEAAIAAFISMVRSHRGQVDPDPRDDHRPPSSSA